MQLGKEKQMKRKSKKDDTPIEMMIALAIGIYTYTKTKSLDKSVIIFFISLRETHFYSLNFEGQGFILRYCQGFGNYLGCYWPRYSR